MNQLSQLLYWGHVAGNIGGFAIFFGCLLLAFCLVCLGFCAAAFDSMNKYDLEDIKEELKRTRWGVRWGCLGLFFVFVFWTIAAFTPDRDTVYAIAASELGGKVLNSETGSLAEQALNAWLKKQISPAPAAPESK